MISANLRLSKQQLVDCITVDSACNVTVTGVDMNKDGTHDVRVHGSS